MPPCVSIAHHQGIVKLSFLNRHILGGVKVCSP
jgi:hypothetical protein